MSAYRDLLTLQMVLKDLPEGGVWKYHHPRIVENSLEVNWGAILKLALGLGEAVQTLEAENNDLRSAVIDSVDLSRSMRTRERHLAALRKVANKLDRPFSLDTVTELLEQWALQDKKDNPPSF